jgi:hypothetical protein
MSITGIDNRSFRQAIDRRAETNLFQLPAVGQHQHFGVEIMAGPKVFLDYDQAALDAADEQTVYAANCDQLLGRYVCASDLTRRHLGPPQRFAYGRTEMSSSTSFGAPFRPSCLISRS